jgi:hypothetical protein
MGSGASASGSNTPNDDAIMKKYGVQSSQIKIIDGEYYYNQERRGYKLPSDILNALDNGNNFSKDQDPDVIKAKATKTGRGKNNI